MSKTADTESGFKSISIDELMDEITARFRSQLHPSTIKAMRHVLREMQQLGAKTTADLMTPEALDRYAAKLTASSFAPFTKKSYINALKTVCRRAVEWGYLAASPFDARPEIARDLYPGISKTDPPKLKNPAQLMAVLSHLESNAATSLARYRVYALVAVAVYIDMCFSDAVRVRVADVDFKAGTFTTGYRDGRMRKTPAVLPLPAELSRILAGWLEVASRFAPPQSQDG